MAAIHEGRLDGRTKEARAVNELMRNLDDDFEGTASAILKRNIAANEVIQKMIAEYMAGCTKQDEVRSLLNDMLRLQAATVKALENYKNLKAKAKGSNSGVIFDFEKEE